MFNTPNTIKTEYPESVDEEKSTNRKQSCFSNCTHGDSDPGSNYEKRCDP